MSSQAQTQPPEMAYLVWVAPSIDDRLKRLLGRNVERDERAKLGVATEFSRALFPKQPLEKHLVVLDFGGGHTEWLEHQEKTWQWTTHRLPLEDGHTAVRQRVLALLDELASIPGHLALGCNDDYGGQVTERLNSLRNPRNGYSRRVVLLNLERASDFAGAQVERFDLAEIGVVPDFYNALEEEEWDASASLRAIAKLRQQGLIQPHQSIFRDPPTGLLGRVGNGAAQVVRKVASRAASPPQRDEITGSATLSLRDLETLLKRQSERS